MKNMTRTFMALALSALVGVHVHANPPASGGSAGPAAPSSKSSSGSSLLQADKIATQVVGGLLLAFGGYLIKDVYDFIKGQVAGASDLKTTQLAQVSGEIKVEADKIAMANAETAALHNQYNNLVMLFNGGINTGLDKKEIQAEIKKVWEALKCNSAHSALVIQEAKEKIRELEGKRDELNAPKLSSLKETALPTQTRRITPALAAQGLAAQRAAAAA